MFLSMAENHQKKFSLRNVFKSERRDKLGEIAWGEYLVDFVLCAGALMMLGGLVILGLQAMEYADTTQWAPRPFMLLLDSPPEIAFKGVEVVVHWLLDFPQSGTLIVVGFLLIVSHVSIDLMWPDRD